MKLYLQKLFINHSFFFIQPFYNANTNNFIRENSNGQKRVAANKEFFSSLIQVMQFFAILKMMSDSIRFIQNIVEKLIYNYYNTVDNILFEESSCQVWANDLDLELHKSVFFDWLEYEKRPNQKFNEMISNYTNKLCEHKGHKIVLSLLVRGFAFDPFLTDWYKEQLLSARNF